MEFLDIANEVREWGNAGAGAITLYLAVVSGYLVAAFIAAKELTKFQSIFISTIFVVFASFCTLGTFTYFYAIHQVTAIYGPEVGYIVLTPIFSYIISAAEVFGIIGSLHFMHQARNR
jgi:hypothetical protein